MEPEEINIIVHSCKGLHVRKKGKSRFSVIFGVGSNKFRTAFVEDALGSVVWNEESTVSVENNEHPLLFVVTDKDNVLGQVTVPLETITLSRQKYDAPLRPHKKNNDPQGELSFSCWVSKYVTVAPAITVEQDQNISKTASLSKLFSRSPLFKRKDKSKNNESHIGNQRYSLSMVDVKRPSMEKRSSGEKAKSHFFSHIDLVADKRSPRLRAKSSPKIDFRSQSSPKIDSDFSRPRSNSQESSASSSSGFVSHVDPTESGERISQGSEVSAKDTYLCLSKVPEESGAPEVTGISPKEGSTTGLTRLTIRGTNLGVNTPDVVGLYVCGSNCLSTLEYVSPNKLHCITKAWRPGSGDIIIVTQTGGRGKCSVQYTFVEPPAAQELDPSGTRRPTLTRTPASAESSPSAYRLDLDRRADESPSASATPSPRNSNPKITVQDAGEFSVSMIPSQSEVPDQTSDAMIDSLSISSGTSLQAFEMRSHDGYYTVRRSSSYSVSSEGGQSAGEASVSSRSSGIEKVQLKRKMSLDPQLFVHMATPSMDTPLEIQPTALRRHSLPPQVASEIKGLLSRLSGNKNVDIKEDDESTPPAFRKRGSIRDTSIRYSKETLMTEIKRLRDENKAIKEQNEAMTIYIDRLVSKVILHCPELLSIDTQISKS